MQKPTHQEHNIWIRLKSKKLNTTRKCYISKLIFFFIYMKMKCDNTLYVTFLSLNSAQPSYLNHINKHEEIHVFATQTKLYFYKHTHFKLKADEKIFAILEHRGQSTISTAQVFKTLLKRIFYISVCFVFNNANIYRKFHKSSQTLQLLIIL